MNHNVTGAVFHKHVMNQFISLVFNCNNIVRIKLFPIISIND